MGIILIILAITLILKLLNKSQSYWRKTIIVLLIIVFPTIVVFDKDCYSYNYLDGINSTALIVTITDVLFELFSGNYGMSFYGNSIWYYDTYFIIELYSVFFFIFYYNSLKKLNLPILQNNFIEFYKKTYLKLFCIILLVSSLIIYNNITTNTSTNLEYSKNFNLTIISYLIIYFIIFIIFKKIKVIDNKLNFLFILLLLFFPTIGVSDVFRKINNCISEGFDYERIVTIKPLLYAFPETIISFFEDINRDHFNLFLNIKFYSLFQQSITLALLPSILIKKEEKNA